MRDFVITRLKGFLQYSNLLNELVIRDIKVRYRKSVLGMLWTVLNPLMMMVVMTVVFSTLFKSEIPNFPVYFLTGNLCFTFYSEATTQAMGSIIGNASLIKKIYIPKYLFPVSKVFSCIINMGFSYLALLLVMLITGAKFHFTMLLTPVLMLYLLLFVTGMSLILSAVTVFFRDINHFYSVLILAWTYFTPIFYPIEILPIAAQKLMNLNPLYHYISYFRLITREGVVPSVQANLCCIAFSIMTLVLGLIVFWKKQDEFILYI